ncbi:MAG TPA: AMP-binding protein, partial [Dehalococcoidia bacterium]|nr:AMP-binding protein [Dehalococcoidia bacterium]
MNRLRVIFDRGLTAANVVDRICDAHPDSPLIHLSSPLPYRLLGSTQITGRQLLPFVNRLGNALLGAGMNRHDRVAVWKDNSVDYIFFALAIIKAGGIAVPINGGMGPAELRRYLEYTGSQIVITDAKHLAQAPERFPMVQTFLVTGATEGLAAPHLDINAALESASDQLSPAALHPDSDILIVHTSGTTGFPKGVLTSSGSLVAGIKGHYKVEPVSTRTRTAVAAPFNHLVCHVGLFSAMLGNLPVWPIGRFDAAQALDLIEREKITAFFGFPDVYLQLLESLEGRDLSSVQVWISTADAAHQAHMREFTQAGALVKLFGRRVVRSLFVDVLGTSEVGFAALTRMTFAARSGPPRRMVGIPSYAGPRVKVADPDGRPLRPGQIGRLM